MELHLAPPSLHGIRINPLLNMFNALLNKNIKTNSCNKTIKLFMLGLTGQCNPVV